MTTRRTLLKSATALVALSLVTPAFAQSNEPIPVVASFSILGEMATLMSITRPPPTPAPSAVQISCS